MLQNSKALADQKRKNILIWCAVLFFTAAIITVIVLVIRCPRRQFLSRVFVSEAKIVQMEMDTDSSPTKKYLKIKLVNPSVTGVLLNEDNSWVEVSDDYYSRHKTGDSIGVLAGNYDIFKDKYWGLFQNGGQTFEKNVWGIEDIFDSVDTANETYPKRDFTDSAQLKKKAAANKTFYFVLTYEERDMTVEVSEEQYNQYNENDTVSCKFSGYGDFIKITSVE